MTYWNLGLKNPTQKRMLERVSRVSEETRGIWSKAHLAVLEAQHMRRTVQAQIESLCGDEEFRRKYRDAMLSKILRAAIAGTHAGMGNIQLYDEQSNRLRIHVFEGFYAPFLDYFSSVEAGHAACGTAMKSRARVIVPDVTNSQIFSDGHALEVLLDAGVRAVQSTPLLGTRRQFLGVFSTHHPTPHCPSDKDLHTIDYFAGWAAALVEWHDNAGQPSSLLFHHGVALAR